MKMNFICIIIKNHFHINGLGLSLTLKVRFSELGNGLLRQTFEVAAARTSGLVNLVLSCQTRFCTRLLGLGSKLYPSNMLGVNSPFSYTKLTILILYECKLLKNGNKFVIHYCAKNFVQLMLYNNNNNNKTLLINK